MIKSFNEMIDFVHKGVLYIYEFIKFTLQKPESQNFLDLQRFNKIELLDNTIVKK